MREAIGLLANLLALGLITPVLGFQGMERGLAAQARTELFAARYDRAIELYRRTLAQEPTGDTYYGLTRALLKAHRSKEAYAIVEEGLIQAGQTAGAQTAAGLASFRKGEIAKAEGYFLAARKLDTNYAGALSGLAAIHSAISNVKTARDLLNQAYIVSPDDPILILAHANGLKGDEHIAALERAAAILDPESEEARALRVHIISDRAIGGRKVRRLVSPYESARIRLVAIMDNPQRLRGYGLRVQFNRHYTAKLLLDTGASGISMAPKMAQKAGLELLSGQSTEMKGIGDNKAQDSLSFLSSEVRIGNVIFADYPVSAFHSAKDSDIDGLIGADVFQQFIINLNFPALELTLEPSANARDDELQNAGPLSAGFHPVLRAGNHLMIGTSVNGSTTKWFLLDSGSLSNFIDTESARDFTGVHGDELTAVRGIQGKVNHVSRADHITLVFGGFRQENPDLIAISLEKASDSMGVGITGVIGMPVLTQLKMAIDYRAGAVRLEKGN